MSRRDVLRANAEFYRAFTECDVAAMKALWASEASVACIHPGGAVLRTRESIIESWYEILTGGGVKIRCLQPEVFLNGDTALVTCFEQIEDHVLLASNLFVLEKNVWKMVHHHAATTAARPQTQPVSRAIH